MQNVILAIHIIACVTLVGVILLQRSEGGALGMGGGGGGGLMSGRSAAGALVRTTMITAGIFFLTTLTLTTMANRGRVDTSVIGGGEIPLDIRDVTNDPTVPLFNETPTDDAVTDTAPILEDTVADTPDEAVSEPFVERAPVDNEQE